MRKSRPLAYISPSIKRGDVRFNRRSTCEHVSNPLCLLRPSFPSRLDSLFPHFLPLLQCCPDTELSPQLLKLTLFPSPVFHIHGPSAQDIPDVLPCTLSPTSIIWPPSTPQSMLQVHPPGCKLHKIKNYFCLVCQSSQHLVGRPHC